MVPRGLPRGGVALFFSGADAEVRKSCYVFCGNMLSVGVDSLVIGLFLAVLNFRVDRLSWSASNADPLYAFSML